MFHKKNSQFLLFRQYWFCRFASNEMIDRTFAYFYDFGYTLEEPNPSILLSRFSHLADFHFEGGGVMYLEALMVTRCVC